MNYNLELFIETDRYCYIKYNGSPVKNAIYDKETEECQRSTYCLTNKEHGIPLSIRNVSLDGNYFIGIIPCDQLLFFSRELQANNFLNQEQVNKIKNTKINGNPIILKIYL